MNKTLFAVLMTTVLAACSAPGQTSKTDTTEKNTSQTTDLVTSEVPADKPITFGYTSGEYGFALNMPDGWGFSEGVDVDGSPFILLSSNLNADTAEAIDRIVILPVGGGGHGILSYEEEDTTVGGFSATQWVVEGNTKPSAIFLKEFPRGWSASNRIDIYYGSQPEDVKQILDSFTSL